MRVRRLTHVLSGRPFLPTRQGQPLGAQRVHPSQVSPGLCPATAHWFRATCSHNQALKVAKDAPGIGLHPDTAVSVHVSAFHSGVLGTILRGRCSESLSLPAVAQKKPICLGCDRCSHQARAPLLGKHTGVSLPAEHGPGWGRPLLVWWPHCSAHVSVSCHHVIRIV